MIGRWLALLTEQQEDNLLTTKLVPFAFHVQDQDAGCLVGAALKDCQWGFGTVNPRGGRTLHPLWLWWDGEYHSPITGVPDVHHSIAYRFNELCQRLVGVHRRQRVPCAQYQGTPSEVRGGARAAALIRTRILKHRAQRALAGVTPKEEEALCNAISE